MMKKNGLLMAMLFLTGNLLAQYCIPPSFTNGPYTAIQKVKIGDIDHASGVADGYSDFTASAGTADLTKGTEVTFSWTLFYDPAIADFFTGSINLRVWIDWNQDFDFSDAGETALAEVDTKTGDYTTFTHTFTVPNDAVLGETRMRVYEDMLVEDGHLEPQVCGYTEGLGQHGECEDYTVNVIAGTAGISDELTLNSTISIYPNPAVQMTQLNFNLLENQEVAVNIYNAVGQVVYTYNGELSAGIHKIDITTSDFGKGFYNVEIVNGQGERAMRKLIID